MGPLEVKEVTADSALVSWHKPDDNGGDEILNYLIEKLDTRTGDWEKVKTTASCLLGILIRVQHIINLIVHLGTGFDSDRNVGDSFKPINSRKR